MAVTGSLLLLTYDSGLVPAGGVEVVASPAAPVKSIGKDPAGHIFHKFALRQSGLFGKHELSTFPAAFHRAVNILGEYATTGSFSPDGLVSRRSLVYVKADMHLNTLSVYSEWVLGRWFARNGCGVMAGIRRRCLRSANMACDILKCFKLQAHEAF